MAGVRLLMEAVLHVLLEAASEIKQTDKDNITDFVWRHDSDCPCPVETDEL